MPYSSPSAQALQGEREPRRAVGAPCELVRSKSLSTRVEFKWFETVDMRNNADADRLDRPDRSRYRDLGKKSPFRDAPITVVGLMEGLIVDG